MQPRVAVVIPCFNGERFLPATVASVLDQDFGAFEVVIVNDGSTDGTAALLSRIEQSDARVRVIEIPNSGVAAARNAGFAQLSPECEYVLFLDADDLLSPSALSRLVRRLDAEPTLGAVFGTCARIDADGKLIAPAPQRPVVHRVDAAVRATEAPPRVSFWDFAAITPISTPGQCLIRRATLGTESPFDPACVPCEDWDLWLRISRRADVGVEYGEVLRYRDHGASASKRYALMQRQRGTVFAKHAALVAPEERSRFRTAWRYGMYGFDSRLCLDWSRQQLRLGDVRGAARYAVRSLRFKVGAVRDWVGEHADRAAHPTAP